MKVLRRFLALAIVAASVASCTGSGGGTAPTTTVPPFSRPIATWPPTATWPPAAGTPEPPFLPPVTFAPIDPPAFGSPVSGFRAPMRFTRQAIVDPSAGNLEAVVFLVPQGWQAEGFVQWTPEWSRVAQLHTRVTDPASGTAIQWLPVQDFIWFEPPAGLEAPIGGNYQGKMFVPPVTDPAQFVRDSWMPTVLPHLQGAALVRIDQIPVIAEEMKRQYGGQADALAFRLRYEFAQNGQPWEEEVSFALLYTGSAGITSWFVNFAYAARAPTGVLDRDRAMTSTVIASRTSTPEWEGVYRLVQGLFYQGIQQQMADTEAFGRLLAQYRAESQALQQQVTDERQASQDRISELRRQTLGGVETYVNPIDRTFVELPVGWNEYWVNPRGEFLTADQPNFDPNQFDNQGWQRLERPPG